MKDYKKLAISIVIMSLIVASAGCAKKEKDIPTSSAASISTNSSSINSTEKFFDKNPETPLNEDELPTVETYSDLFGRLVMDQDATDEYRKDEYTHDCFGFYVGSYSHGSDRYKYINTFSKEDEELFESGEPFIDRQVLDVVGIDSNYIEGATYTIHVSRLSDYADLLNIPDANEEDIIRHKYGHDDTGVYYSWTGDDNLEPYNFEIKDGNSDGKSYEYHGIVINGFYVEFGLSYTDDRYDIFPRFIWQRETPIDKSRNN